jgi:hypothetical protein
MHQLHFQKIKIILIVLAIVPCLLGGGEPVKPVPEIETPNVQVVEEESIKIPSDLKPSYYKVVDVNELSIADLMGDSVYSETEEFFIENGMPKQIVRLDPGVNSVYIRSGGAKKGKIERWEILLLPEFRDVEDRYPFLKEIQYITLLKIMGAYQGEGGVFLPENGVPRKEFSIVLQQATKVNPKTIDFSRLGEKEYVDVPAAIQALEANLGEPVDSWSRIFGNKLANDDSKITRAELARALLNMKIINQKMSKITKDFDLDPLK